MTAKAPERLKREILNTPINEGGFGMIEVSDLNYSIKIKAIGRLFNSNHPFSMAVRETIDVTDPFNLKIIGRIDPFVEDCIEKLNDIRKGLIGREELAYNRKYIALVKRLKLKNIISLRGKGSLQYLHLRNRGVLNIDQVTDRELQGIRHFIERSLLDEIERVKRLEGDGSVLSLITWLFRKDKLVDINDLTSQSIRLIMRKTEPICVTKFGSIATPAECLQWGRSLKKVTSVKYRNILLKVAHGEVYTKEKLYRFSLVDTPICPRCDQVETLTHKYLECNYISRIWSETLRITSTVNEVDVDRVPRENLVLGIFEKTDPIVLSIHAEVLNRINGLRNNANFLLHPKTQIKLALKSIDQQERSLAKKDVIKNLLIQLDA